MLDHPLAAPAGNAACKIGGAIAVTVELGGNGRVFQVTQILDASIIGRFVDQIALHHASHERADLFQHGVAARLFEKGAV